MRAKLGILAGGGDLPAHLISACRETGREYYVLALEGQAEEALIGESPHGWVRLGAVGKCLKMLRAAGVQEVVMAGRVTRPSLVSLRPDARAVKALARAGTGSFGDGKILRLVVEEIESEDIRVVALESVLPELLAPEGVLGAVKPDGAARRDIARGIEVARGIGQLDVGQAAVVQQAIVLGVEAVDGTDALIARCANLRRAGPGGVLVKVKKPGQDARVDLPSIGVSTVRAAAAAGLRGIAVEAGGSGVIDRTAVVGLADAAGLFVVGVKVAE